MSVRRALRSLVEAKQALVVPGAYDGVSARLVERAGFPAVYMTGFGTSASRLGLPDLGYLNPSRGINGMLGWTATTDGGGQVSYGAAWNHSPGNPKTGRSTRYTAPQLADMRKLHDSCQICGLREPQILQVHHLDGKHSNNSPDNLLMVCPNCHARIHKSLISPPTKNG
jgi:hypothetical protein